MKKILIILLIATSLLSIVYAQQSWNNMEYAVPDQFHLVESTAENLYLEDNKTNSIRLKIYDKDEYVDVTDGYNKISDNTYQLNNRQINETRYTKDDDFIYTYIFEENNHIYSVYYKTSDETIYVTNTFNPAHALINSLKG